MKKLILTALLGIACYNNADANTLNSNTYYYQTDEKINIIFQNNDGVKPATTKKYKLTIEDVSGNKTVEEFSLGEMSRRKTIAIAVGSKVYVENGSKLNTLVGGKAPDKSEPFMVVMLRDKNQTINLNEEVVASEYVVLANAQKSAEKLKLDANLKTEIMVTGNIATVYYKDANGKIKAAFDCDKKNGNVKNIDDRRKQEDQTPAKSTEKEGVKKIKGLLNK